MNDSRTSRFIKNILSTGVYQVTAMILGFVTPRLMMLFYGSEVNGLIVSVTDFLTYFKMVESGLAAAAYTALYDPLAKRDMPAVSAIVSAARGFYNTAGWLFSGMVLVFAAIYPLFVPVNDILGNPMNYLSIFALILAMGISGSLEFFTMSRYRVLLTADQKTYIVSLTSMASLLLNTACIVVLPFLGADVITVRLAASLTILVRAWLITRYAKKHYPNVNIHAKPNKEALKDRWAALCVELTIVFQQGAGVIIGTVVTRDAAALSVYGVYHMVTVGLWGILKMGTTGIYSIFGNVMVSEKKEVFQKVYNDFEVLYHMMVSILFGTAAVLIVPFVNIYTNGVEDANYNVPMLGILIIVEALTNHCKMPLDIMISTSGCFRQTRPHCYWQMGTTLVTGAALGLLLLPYGSEASLCGIVAGVCLGNLVRTFLQLRYIPKNILDLPWKPSFIRMIRMFLTVTLIAAPLILWGPVPHRFFTWVMYAVALAAYSTVITLAVTWLFDRATLKALFERGKSLLSRITK